MIKAVTFDLDNTLWDTYGVLNRAQEAMQAWIGERVPEYRKVPSDVHREIYVDVTKKHPEILHDVSKVRVAVLRRTFERCGYERQVSVQLAREAFQVFYNQRQNVLPFPETIPLLDELKNDYKLASITNGNADVEQTPLSPYFDVNITAANAGSLKPNPEPFQSALSLLRVRANEAVHVGDSLQDDVDGALNVGMRAIWMKREGTTEESTDHPTATELSQIPRLLQEMERP